MSDFGLKPDHKAIGLKQMNNETPFYVFLLGVFLIVISPALFTHGMFMDGMIYASVAKNMSVGLGTFWQPFFTETHSPEFYGHPPLAMGIVSLFYKIFGDAFFIEKIYSTLCWIFVAIGLVKIWRHFELKQAWLPVLVLMTISRIYWAATNNMLENTLAVFIIFALLFYLKSEKNRIYLLLSGLFLALGFLSKGPVGLFIWCFPFFYQLIYKKQNFIRAFWSSFLLMVLTILPLVLLYSFSNAALNHLINYYEIQISNSIASVETVGSRWYIIGYLLGEITFPLSFSAVLFLIWRIKKINNPIENSNLRLFVVLIITALLGVIPIMISLKQSGFYILPVFPFFALAFSFLFYKQINSWIEKITLTKTKSKIRIFRAISFITLVFAFGMNCLNFGKIHRDFEKIHDMHLVAEKIGDGQRIKIDESMRNDWGLLAYYQRYYGICLAYDRKSYEEFRIINGKLTTVTSNSNLEKITSGTLVYHLYQDTVFNRNKQLLPHESLD